MPVFLRWFLRLAITNPITVRLVQNGSRRTRHLYIRSAYLAVLIVVLLWSLLITTEAGAMSYRQLAQAGAQSFAFIAYLQIALICILAPVFMAGAIAQEASPRTWEVLLTTPLSAVQIVLGNLSGRLFFILGLLFSSLPLFALTQYFGGVAGPTIFASYAIAACAALLVGAIAIALSVSRLVGRRAVFAFYVSVVSYLAVTIGLDYWLRSTGAGAGPRKDGVTWMTAINPFLSLRTMLDSTAYPAAEAGSFRGLKALFLETPVRTWCYGSVLLSLVLLLGSTFTVRSGGLAAMTGVGERGGIPWYRRIFGLGSAGAEHRPPRAVWANPIAWREAAARNSTFPRIIARWSFVGAGAVWGVILVVMFARGTLPAKDFQLAILATVLGEMAVTTLVAMNMAATAISREREDGTLDLLLTTPITPSSYLTGKLRGLIAYVLPLIAVPVGTMLLAGIYILIGQLSGDPAVLIKQTPFAGPGTPISVPVVMPEAGLLTALVAVPFIAFCAMIGLQWSLKSRGTLGSVVGTVGVVGVISGIVGACGWNSNSLGFVGPVMAGLSPASLVFALVHPVQAMDAAVGSGGMEAGRIALWIGCAIAAGVYLGVVYGVHASMVKTFDFTVRKLAGAR